MSDAIVSIVDYGAGNLHSLAKALEMPGTRVRIVRDAASALERSESQLLVLPGVGAFGLAAETLAPARDAIRQAATDGFPILGICLGMQLLFDRSDEGAGAGLGIIPGFVRRVRAKRVPQIGWNTVSAAPDSGNGEMMSLVAYYANSFVCEPRDPGTVTAWTTYETDRFPASVVAGPNDNVIGVQYHPEKSSADGVRHLRALVSRVGGVKLA